MAHTDYDASGDVILGLPFTLTNTSPTLIVPAVPNMKIRLTSLFITVGAATNLSMLSNATIIMPSDGLVDGGMPFGGAGGGVGPTGGSGSWIMETHAGEGLYFKQSVSTRVVGSFNYKLVPT